MPTTASSQLHDFSLKDLLLLGKATSLHVSNLQDYFQSGGLSENIDHVLKYSADSLTKLERAKVSLRLPSEGQIWQITLPHLKILTIDNDGVEGSITGLSCLVVPALEELQVKARGAPVLPPVYNMLSQSTSPQGSLLTKLRLETPPCPPQDLLALFKLTPMVTHLCVAISCCVVFWDKIQRSGDTWEVLPRLMVCAIVGERAPSSGDIHRDWLALDAFIRARCEKFQQLDDSAPRVQAVYISGGQNANFLKTFEKTTHLPWSNYGREKTLVYIHGRLEPRELIGR